MVSILVIRHLELSDQKAFERAIARTKISDPNFSHYYKPEISFANYIKDLLDKESGVSLPNGHVRSSCLYGFVDDEIVGRISIRYELTDFLRKIGGHIGYVVVPEYRRKGYATEMLRQSLVLAKESGLLRVLLTCDRDNIGSFKTIEKCGGILEDIYEGPEVSVPKRRYWINL